MFLDDIIDMAQPIVRKPHPFITQGGQNTAAAIVTADNDMLHMKDIDGKLDDGKRIEIRVDNNVGDIAVYKDFTGSKADQFLGRHTAVGTAYPKILGLLLKGELCKEIGILRVQIFCPRSIVGKEFGY